MGHGSVKKKGNDPAARSKALLVAYGNLSRRDDGVAGHIVSRLRRRLGLAERELENDVRVSESGEVITEDGPEGHPRMQMILLHQLAPELGETLASFDLVVFLDAHVEGATTPEGDLWEDVHLQRIDAGLQTSMVTHHLKPAAIYSEVARAPVFQRGFVPANQHRSTCPDPDHVVPAGRRLHR